MVVISFVTEDVAQKLLYIQSLSEGVLLGIFLRRACERFPFAVQ